MLPAPMLVPSPIVASPMYERCGTFAGRPADPGALHLHVGADLGAVLELHPGAEVGEGAHLAAVADARRGEVRVADAAALADRDVDRDDLRTDLAAVADRGRPTQDRPG